MKLLVLGATGRTGHELVSQALSQDHEVTALASDPNKLSGQAENVRVVVGSATERTPVDQALEHQDAVLCALGPRSPTALLSCDLMRATADALIPSMQTSGVDRLVLLSALGVGQSAPHAPWALRLAFRTLLRRVGQDKAEAEERLRRSPLDWTLVYPPSLTDGARTGTYRHGQVLELQGVPKISRADVADFMLAQLTDSTYRRKPVIVSS
jgi:putative NADH-flavin reductase